MDDSENQDSQETEYKVLSSKELKKITQDAAKPSLFMFVVLEALEWIFWLAILFIIITFTRPIWSPVVNIIKQAIG